jgi:hypothetical protein
MEEPKKEPEKKYECIGRTLCEFCEHNDYKKDLIKRCHEKGNHHKDVRLFPKYSVPYNSRAYRSRNKGFGF